MGPRPQRPRSPRAARASSLLSMGPGRGVGELAGSALGGCRLRGPLVRRGRYVPPAPCCVTAAFLITHGARGCNHDRSGSSWSCSAPVRDASPGGHHEITARLRKRWGQPTGPPLRARDYAYLRIRWYGSLPEFRILFNAAARRQPSACIVSTLPAMRCAAASFHLRCSGPGATGWAFRLLPPSSTMPASRS